MSIYTASFKDNIFSDSNSSLSKILSLLKNDCHLILDLGCSSGYLGKYIKSNHPQVIVDGIEIEKSDFKKATKVLDHVYNIDIQDNSLVSKLPNIYDVLIFADILEHTTNPEKVLSDFTPKLKPGGQILFSIPNITHQSVILELLSNQWNYESSGILDHSHLQYFDFNRVVNLIESNHLYINKLDFTIFDLPSATIKNILSKHRVKGVKYLLQNLKRPQHKIFQYIVSATNTRPSSYKSFKKNTTTLKPVSDFINEWELAIKEYNSKFKNIEEELRQIKNSKFYMLWPWYNRLKHLIKK